MKKFDVYGIGNALIDIDIEVSTDTLDRLGIAKGVMTLIDEQKHHLLLEELDGIKHLKTCGGSAANTLYTMQQMGSKTFCSCKVGSDEAGDFFYQNLVLHGIQTNLHEGHREGITGKCIVLVTPDADRTMNTYLGASAQFSKSQLSLPALKNSEYLYIEGFLVASPPGCEASIVARQAAKKNNVKTALTLADPNMVKYFKEGLCAIIDGQVDVLFCNETESLLFTETDNLVECQKILKLYGKTYVITLGREGSIVFNGQETRHIAAYETIAVDTVGAGDIFAGAFLHAITHGRNYFEAGDLANYAASRVVAKFGPRLDKEDMQAVVSFLEKYEDVAV